MSTDWGHLVGGVTGGIVSTMILHPIDLVKIRMQVERNRSQATMREVLRSVYRQLGWRGFYNGVTPNMAASGVAWGTYFFQYNTIKLHMRSHATEKLSPLQHISAAMLAGAGSMVVTNPLWVVKTRMCSAPTWAQLPYRGIWHGLKTIFQSEGLAGLYSGMVPGLIGVSHGACQFVVYEELKHFVNQKRGLHSEAKLETVDYLWTSAVSKAMAVAITYPYQVVRARLQLASQEHRSALKICRELYRFEGAAGFYKGLTANLLRVTPATAITFVVYENTWRLFHADH
eukprot:m.239386 g.239386  ORF g.239386 m.239386 type:complete len:286 (+) comp54371_c0_seq1:76-933(+)